MATKLDTPTHVTSAEDANWYTRNWSVLTRFRTPRGIASKTKVNLVQIPIAAMNPRVPETLHRYHRGLASVTSAATARRHASSELLNGRTAKSSTGHDDANAIRASAPAV